METPTPNTPSHEYESSHRHPINRLLHFVGIPCIVFSLPCFFWKPLLAAGLFAGGWVLQFAGHAIEGNRPAFFSHPKYLLVGPMWWIKKLAKRK